MEQENIPYICPSILAANATTPEEIKQALQDIQKAGAELVHVDVMDGTFVEATTLWNTPKEVRFLSKNTTLPLDVHLMIHNPVERYQEFITAGAQMISFHIEAEKNPEKLIKKIQQQGVRAGLAINPETPIEQILPYLPLLDYVLVMSVHPGKYGQTFETSILEKLPFLDDYEGLVEVDGGVNTENAPELIASGVTILVTGSTFFTTKKKKEIVQKLKGITHS